MSEPMTFDAAVALARGTRPVLIAGPTASGKSELALRIAQTHGGIVVNADASQVFGCWQIVTARPGPADLARAPHALYGHLAWNAAYSAGHWLREVAPMLERGPRPIIVGGTGLFFGALTEGLADIPAVDDAVRDAGNSMTLAALIDALDAQSAAGLDLANRARVQRAWEVLRQTGRGIAQWQAETPAPTLPVHGALCLALDAPRDWLNARISLRFERMLEAGALDEVSAMRASYAPRLPAFRAIGVPELMAHLDGSATLDAARERVVIATRRYAKRQRTWLRARMSDWRSVNPLPPA